MMILLLIQGVLIVANKSDDTVSFVDTRTFEVIGTASTGRGPHELTLTTDGKKAVVANYEGSGDSVTILDVETRKATGTIWIKPYAAPHGIAASGNRVYATCEKSEAVIEIDVEKGEVVRSIKTGQRGSHMLAVAPDGKKLYTANMGDGSVTAIDLVKGEAVATIETGRECEGIDITPDGKTVWAANRAAGTISVIEDDKVAATLECGGFPIRVKFTPDGKRALVSCMKANAVAVFDVAGRKELSRIDTGAAPIGIVIDAKGERAYVACTEADEVVVVDLASGKPTDRIKTGRTPDGMALILR